MKSENRWEEAVKWLSSQPSERQLVIDSYYDDPLESAAERYESSPEWVEINAYLQGRVGLALDVGAGRGIASYALAKGGFEVTALEPNDSDLVGAGAIRALAKATGHPIKVVETVSEELPFENASFNVVFARAVLHHTSNLPAACREFARVLKPGGLFIAAREHVISRRNDLPVFLDAHPLHKLYGGENAFLLKEYRAALRGAGLRWIKQLAPLDSPINYFPQTRESLRAVLSERLRSAPFGGSLLAVLAERPVTGDLALKLASLFDNRPGRLYSFILEKPA